MNILFKNIDIVTMDEPGVIYDGHVIVSDGIITHVGKELPSGGIVQKVVYGREKY